MKITPDSCPDCPDFSDFAHTLPRRAFIRQTAGTAAFAAASAALPSLANAAKAGKKKNQGKNSETLVKSLYDSLTDKQRGAICFPFDHELRLKVDNNWHITKTDLHMFTADQQAMIKEIFLGLHSPEYADTVYNQVVHDSGRKGFENSSIAIFGEPGSGKFQFVLTGRHCTRRCDGDSVDGASFGGPIFYGHAADTFNEGPDHKGNAYWYQAVRANEVFEMLDGKQREVALHEFGRRERGTETVKLTGNRKGLDGIRVGDLSKDQQEHTRKVIVDLLAPYRAEDVKESMKYIEAAGFENLHLAFYRKGDIGEDKVWDVWQIEGPSAIFYFRGSPHVHAWIHIKDSAFEKKDPFAA